ncbi:MAG: hypothetical protein HYY92_02320 [Parcubacteria group bacterium]|nr:hypothetical protein [Parcubacteria group bacterium]
MEEPYRARKILGPVRRCRLETLVFPDTLRFSTGPHIHAPTAGSPMSTEIRHAGEYEDSTLNEAHALMSLRDGKR